jgi:hypothetical protein
VSRRLKNLSVEGIKRLRPAKKRASSPGLLRRLEKRRNPGLDPFFPEEVRKARVLRRKSVIFSSARWEGVGDDQKVRSV